MKMYVEIADLPALYHEAEKILTEVRSYWQPAGSPLILSPNQHLYHDNRIRHLADQGHYFLVSHGVLNYVHREKNVFYYEEGDFIGLFGEAEQDDVQIVSGHDEASVGLVPYAWDSLIEAFKKDTAVADLWFRYLQILLQTFIAAEESRASILPKISPRVIHKKSGESIT